MDEAHQFSLTGLDWVQGSDLNRGPSGYEPDELPDCSTLQYLKFKVSVAGKRGVGRKAGIEFPCQCHFHQNSGICDKLPLANSGCRPTFVALSKKTTKLKPDKYRPRRLNFRLRHKAF